ncbi:MAG: hypothetical protein JST10_07220 [Bacteroidetes bacterium]|nr:hypothetical protein [Bacteroidota bacterium]MBS1632347.1 hypothetical protein [Bacteroidota bacterium]
MKRQFTYILSIIFLFVISSCKKPEVNSSFEENIKIKMTETVDSVNRVLNLNCFTEKIFECSNYGIEATYTLTDNKITINFIRIISPNICLTSLGPASTIISLNGLANKTYELEINFGANKIAGQLNVTTDSFVATLPTQTKVQFVNSDLKRIPNNTIYGQVHFHSASTSSLVQKFIDTLQLYGATPTLYPQGDYGQFQIDANRQIIQTQDFGYYFTRYYIFNYSNNSAQLKDLVKRFGINYPNLLLITLNTTKGETFYSWTQ